MASVLGLPRKDIAVIWNRKGEFKLILATQFLVDIFVDSLPRVMSDDLISMTRALIVIFLYVHVVVVLRPTHKTPIVLFSPSISRNIGIFWSLI